MFVKLYIFTVRYLLYSMFKVNFLFYGKIRWLRTLVIVFWYFFLNKMFRKIYCQWCCHRIFCTCRPNKLPLRKHIRTHDSFLPLVKKRKWNPRRILMLLVPKCSSCDPTRAVLIVVLNVVFMQLLNYRKTRGLYETLNT